MRLALCLGLVFSCGWILGCAKEGPPRKRTFKVTGVLTVDGQPPNSPLQIQCHDLAGLDKEMPTLPQAVSQPDGKFEISTYEKGDGIPIGEYVLTVAWHQFNAISMSYGGPDKLNKRYSDAKESTIKFSVIDKPVDLGEIKLTTK
ncbi:MAG TPA: hypothetical protein VFG20_17970 [Planctomycetaceae bacterium]|nr:hypothetical protein [Planctomycetaceae bacterium]